MQENLCLSVGHQNADLTGSTNTVIQAAVDRIAAAGGGAVKILPGNYIMHDSLHLRTGVRVEGSGSDTVLLKPPSVSSPIIYFLGYGHFDVSVAEPEKFKVGTGICVTDLDAGGFYNTVTAVIGKNGSELIIGKMLNHDYHPSRGGRVISVYPVISGCDIRNVSVSDLTVDGNASENEYLNGCRGGGIFLLQAHHVKLNGITVKNYNGDAVSFQQCRNTLIENCICHDNTGTGLHPGSGSVGAVMRNITCRGNGGDGIFYCLRVSFSLCEHCIFEENAGNGISIGHRDTDAIIRNNIIRNNGRHGIYFRKDDLNKTGCRTLITRNDFGQNCRTEGTGEIFFDSTAEEVAVHDNEGLDKALIKGARESYLKGIVFDSKDMKAGPDYADESSGIHLGPDRNGQGAI